MYSQLLIVMLLEPAMTSGFIVPTDQIPRGIRWIKSLSFHRIVYQTWISLEFTDRRFDCPYSLSSSTITSNNNSNGSGKHWDPVHCKPWEGNTILVDQLQGEPNAPLYRLAFLVGHYFGYLLLAWLVLTIFPKKDTFAVSRKSPFEKMFLPLTRLFVSKGAEEPIGKTTRNQGAGNKESFGIEAEGVRIDISGHGHEQLSLVPVTVRVEKLSLSLVEQAGSSSSEGERRKILLDNIDIIIPPAKLTAILGGSGSGKVTPYLTDATLIVSDPKS
jgi:ABC-type multidrug transport system fused ATPase/permease subunit